MRVQVMSDLHTDFPGAGGVPQLAQGATLVLVAGDTCQGLVRSIEMLRRAFPNTEIAMVAGNHEYYGLCLPDELEAGRARAEELGVYLLERNAIVIGNLRVIGATTWTDYRSDRWISGSSARYGANAYPRTRWHGDASRNLPGRRNHRARFSNGRNYRAGDGPF